MTNLILSYVSNHQQFVYGLVLGAIVSNPGTCAVLLFNLFVKIPGIGSWIAKHPDQAKGWADQFDKAIDSEIAKYAEANKKENDARQG